MNSSPYTPLPDEHRELKKYYFGLSVIMIMFIFVFSCLSRLTVFVSAGIISGDFSSDGITAGKSVIAADPLMSFMFSYGFAIAADLIAVAVGIKTTGIDLKKKIRFSGFDVPDLFKYTSSAFGISTVSSFVMVFLMMIILLITGKLADNQTVTENAINTLSDSTKPLWYDLIVYFYAVILGPVLEEIIFRGILLEGLRKYGNFFGIVMSSVMFGLMHQNFTQCIPAFAIGMVMAYADVKSDSIMPSLFIHILNNGLATVMMILMNNTDMSMFYDIVKDGNISGLMEFITSPLAICLGLNSLFRLVTVILTGILMIRFYGNKKRLFSHSEYCRERTWKYIFKSFPWLVVLGFLLITTILSLFR